MAPGDHQFRQHAPPHGGSRHLRVSGNGVDFAIVSAGTLMSVAPLLMAFLLFQRQFVQSFMRAGIK